MEKLFKKALKNAKLPLNTNVEELKGRDLFNFNKEYQLLIGNEEYDYLTINCFLDKETFFKSNTLKDFDYDDWKYQKEHGTLVRDEYDSLYLPGLFFRAMPFNMFNKRDLLYGQLESAQSYVTKNVIEKLENKLSKIYPFLYVTEYGKSIFNDEYTEKRAGGFEKERSIIEEKIRNRERDIQSFVILELEKYSDYTFIDYSDKPKTDHLDIYIIGGFKAAEQINPKSFFKDFTKKQQPVELLEKEIKKIYKIFKKEIFRN